MKQKVRLFFPSRVLSRLHQQQRQPHHSTEEEHGHKGSRRRTSRRPEARLAYSLSPDHRWNLLGALFWSELHPLSL